MPNSTSCRSSRKFTQKCAIRRSGCISEWWRRQLRASSAQSSTLLIRFIHNRQILYMKIISRTAFGLGVPLSFSQLAKLPPNLNGVAPLPGTSTPNVPNFFGIANGVNPLGVLPESMQTEDDVIVVENEDGEQMGGGKARKRTHSVSFQQQSGLGNGKMAVGCSISNNNCGGLQQVFIFNCQTLSISTNYSAKQQHFRQWPAGKTPSGFPARGQHSVQQQIPNAVSLRLWILHKTA